MHKLLLGAHMPIAKGLAQAAVIGKQVGCSAIQIFTKSNRQWHAKALNQDDIQEFKKALIANQILYVNVHASYLINICASDATTTNRSLTALESELIRCHDLGIQDLVLHPGARKDQPVEVAIKKFSTNLDLVLKNTPPNTRILIENMAGQGSVLGSNFNELSQILDSVHHQKRVGVCVDTCHALAAGYDFSDSDKYHKFWSEFNRAIGKDRLGLIHLNDSKGALGSKVDRHANIGHGEITMNAFQLIMNDVSLRYVPKILETPKMDLVDDQKNLQTLVNLISKENLKYLKETNLEMYIN